MRDRRNVVRFRRGARRPPRWDMGTPLGRRPPGRGPRRRAGIVAAAAVLGLVVLPPVGDAVNGVAKSFDGCRIWQVVDGDTVRLYCPVSGFSQGRILAYDTPEMAGDCLREMVMARAAKQYLRWILWTGTDIRSRTEGLGRYGRSLVVLIVDGEGVARRMIQAGLAREYDGGRRASWCEQQRIGRDV